MGAASINFQGIYWIFRVWGLLIETHTSKNDAYHGFQGWELRNKNLVTCDYATDGKKVVDSQIYGILMAYVGVSN